MLHVSVHIDWKAERVQNHIRLEMIHRTNQAVEHLKRYVQKAISIPVVHRADGTVERSTRGQYPRLETGQLRDTMFHHVAQTEYGMEGVLGAVQDYAVPLEDVDAFDRRFLSRGLHEQTTELREILTRKIQ